MLAVVKGNVSSATGQQSQLGTAHIPGAEEQQHCLAGFAFEWVSNLDLQLKVGVLFCVGAPDLWFLALGKEVVGAR